MKHAAYIKLAVVILLSAGAGIPLISQSVTIGYINVMDDAPVHVAYEGNYYSELGLEVELVRFSSGTDLIKGIVTGRLDAGVLGFTNAISWASRGADLKIIGGAQRGYHSLLIRDNAGIGSIAELKGHSLASQKQGSTADIVLENIVLRDGAIEKQDLTMRYVSPAVAVQALASGAVDAAFLFEPYARIARYTAPVSELYEIGAHWPFPCMVVITAASTWSERRTTVEAVLDAQRQAIELLESDPSAAAALIQDYFIESEYLQTPDGPISSRKIITEAVEANNFDWRLSEEDVDRIREIEGIMRQRGFLGGPVNLDSLIDLSWQRSRG